MGVIGIGAGIEVAMPHEIATELIGGAVELAADLATDKVRRRWGWRGCLGFVVLLGALLLWWLGAFG